jgi:hypothetical protein
MDLAPGAAAEGREQQTGPRWELTDLISVETLQSIQDTFARAFGIPVGLRPRQQVRSRGHAARPGRPRRAREPGGHRQGLTGRAGDARHSPVAISVAIPRSLSSGVCSSTQSRTRPTTGFAVIIIHSLRRPRFSISKVLARRLST